MANIIISYRRSDSAAIAGRIRDRWAQYYGADAIFMDIDSIPLGIDFRQQIQEAVTKNDILRALIGRKRIGAKKAGTREIGGKALGHDRNEIVLFGMPTDVGEGKNQRKAVRFPTVSRSCVF